jgi:hypothetical protein
MNVPSFMMRRVLTPRASQQLQQLQATYRERKPAFLSIDCGDVSALRSTHPIKPRLTSHASS